MEGRYDGVHIPLRLHDPVLVDQAKVVGPHVAEGFAEGVDPEVVGFDWVADCYVAAGAFVLCHGK